MASLAAHAFGERGLREAWSQVLANDAEDGELAASIKRFEEDIDAEIEELVRDLAWGAYQPADLTEVVLPDRKGRVLHIPTVRDRVVERAILDAVNPLVDPVLGPACYAYRPGLGVRDAVNQLARLRDEGLGWVLRTDVHDCFPSIPVALARRLFGALVDDPELLAVVDLLLARGYRGRKRGRRVMHGLAQGCALSPLLANLVLVQVDEALLGEGFAAIRYADDVAVAVRTKEEAWEAARQASAAVEELGMSLGADKTQVVSFDEGFTFLGEDFGPRYPPVLDGIAVTVPDRKVVYVAAQGGRTRVSKGRLLVESADDAELLDVPTGQVRRLVLMGSVGLTAGARSWAMSNEVDVVFASRRGQYQGSLLAASSHLRADRLRRQVSYGATQSATVLGRAIVEAKIRKQIVVLQRFGRREHADAVREAISTMNGCQRMLSECTTTAEAMGLEGAAAAAYFPALGSLLPTELAFTLRSRQPPLDVTNSALSFLYTVLLAEAVTAVCAAGLEPGIGVLHADDERRPSLALDLMEEFRPLIVDQVVVEAARQQRLTAQHGRAEEGRSGVLLTKAGREALLNAYERRMQTTTKGALIGFAGTWRRHLHRQAQRLQAAICSDEVWTGLTWR